MQAVRKSPLRALRRADDKLDADLAGEELHHLSNFHDEIVDLVGVFVGGCGDLHGATGRAFVGDLRFVTSRGLDFERDFNFRGNFSRGLWLWGEFPFLHAR